MPNFRRKIFFPFLRRFLFIRLALESINRAKNQLCAKAQESRSDKESLAKDSMCCFRSSLLRVGISIRIYTLSILAAQALYSAVLQTGSKALLVKMLVGW